MKKHLYYFSPEEDMASEGTGEIETSSADLSGADVEDISTDSAEAEDNSEAEEKPRVDMNSIYADARRRAEAEAEKKYAKKIADIDEAFAKQFGEFENPLTKERITSATGYLAAMEAQRQAEMERELQEKGVNVNLLNDLIQNNPTVREAQMILEQQKQEETKRQIERDVEEISKLDSSIKSLADVPPEVIQMCAERRLNLVEAYKISNYGKWSKDKADSERQAAINQVKGKDHLKPVNGVSGTDELAEIPTAVRGLWETMFPDKSWAERKKLYNKTL